ncbi:HAMP domain-containing protein [Thalassotalea sp. M1531]|uniref:histidine kinase n=1 Tax=Thalassotalea algicola TaxID=2716224 RepID=A0A7Y0LAH6_9GAMM|nr:ATP-binding protein [Thalassotalea algicola]NMP30522.1 HAMP domain-containing protein [Thalassotalea algicola]
MELINYLRKQLSSIKIKLFLWFWLVTVCAIAATRFVSIQLNQEFVKVAIEPVVEKKLKYFVSLTEKVAPSDLWHYLHDKPKSRRMAGAFKHIIIKPQDENERLIGKHRIPREAIKFIHTTTFTEPSTWLLPKVEVSGPIKLTLHDQTYQVFYARKAERRKNVFTMMKQLPYWARIGTPLIVSFIFCWLLARSLSKPLSNISNAAKQFGHGDLSTRLGKDAKRNDELGDLAKSFNHMADKLESNISAHQRLLGDVSHELRSPLTRLQMALALAQKKPKDAEALAQYFNRCELEVSRLDEMLEHVLTLSRLENSSQQIEKIPCQLAKLLASIVEDGNFLGQDKGVTTKLIANCDPDLPLDQSLIASAVSNIINNAIKYSPPNSVVIIKLEQTSEHVSIVVSDQGKGVPDEVLPRLFEAFYRVADARDRATGGTGLGLAIAKQAVVAHGGEIYAENILNSGLKVTITLPFVS